MATFTNQATLAFNGGSVTSNVVTGQLVETLTATKTAVTDSYSAGETVTYVISLINSGTSSLTGLTVTDDLGAYTFDGSTLYPLTYADGSILYYQNGVLQATPAVSTEQPLTVTGITVPASGNAAIIYQARANEYAPLDIGDSITNTATVTGAGLAESVTAQSTVNAADEYSLTISKTLYPSVVSDNGTLTYTFIIENTGNTAADATDNVVLTDTFNPILDPISVTFNGAVWTEDVNYDYDAATGLFSTPAGQITVPAAVYTQNADGTWTVTPGTSILVITGTV